MKRKLLFLVVPTLLLVGFSSCGKMGASNAKQSAKEDTVATTSHISEYLTQAVLWEQTSAEYRALCYQAYNLATFRLNSVLDTLRNKHQLAIITDLDETVLDNSPYEAMCILQHKEYQPADWDNWVNQKNAKAISGAVDFLNFAKSKGIEVFYVSNRVAKQKLATLQNMKKIDIPFSDSAHVLLKKETGAKQPRFDKVAQNHQVLMYLGDNCSDFTSKFRATSLKRRFHLADSLRHHFGKNYIIIPNPMYGDWASRGIFKGKYNWTNAQKDSLRKAVLKAY